MKPLLLILQISLIALLATGLLHIVLLDKILKNKPSYLTWKYWIGKWTILLTILAFGSGVAILIIFLIQ